MTSPNFLIIGAQKGGTTWLARILTKHPDVFMPAREIEFFSKPETMAKGLDWYEENFKNVLQESAIGEKSPSYIWVNQQSLHEVHRHIHEYSPDIKLIAVLRDPVQRAISHARHYMRGARIGGKVSPLASLDHLILNSSLSKGILSRGHYAEQLEAYYQYFKPEQILTIINEEEIVKDPKAVMAKVCNFLEVDASFDFKDADKTVHDGRFSRIGVVLASLLPSMQKKIRYLDRQTFAKSFSLTVSPKTLEKLYDYYSDENEKLFQLLNRRWSSWSMPE